MAGIAGDGDIRSGEIRILREFVLDGGDYFGVSGGIGRAVAKILGFAAEDFTRSGKFVFDVLRTEVEGFEFCCASVENAGLGIERKGTCR